MSTVEKYLRRKRCDTRGVDGRYCMHPDKQFSLAIYHDSNKCVGGMVTLPSIESAKLTVALFNKEL